MNYGDIAPVLQINMIKNHTDDSEVWTFIVVLDAALALPSTTDSFSFFLESACRESNHRLRSSRVCSRCCSEILLTWLS